MSFKQEGSSNSKSTGAQGNFTDRTKEHGIGLGGPDKDGSKNVTQEPNPPLASSDTSLSDESMQSAAEYQASLSDGSMYSAAEYQGSGDQDVNSSTNSNSEFGSMQAGSGAPSNKPPPASGRQRKKPLSANTLPFFGRSFLRYYLAQKNHDKKKLEKKKLEKQKQEQMKGKQKAGR